MKDTTILMNQPVAKTNQLQSITKRTSTSKPHCSKRRITPNIFIFKVFTSYRIWETLVQTWCSKLNLAFSFFIHSAAWHVRQRHSDVAFSRFWGQAKFKNQLSENSPASNRQSVGLTCHVHQPSWHHQTSLDQSPLPHLRGASQQLRGQTTKQNIN